MKPKEVKSKAKPLLIKAMNFSFFLINKEVIPKLIRKSKKEREGTTKRYWLFTSCSSPQGRLYKSGTLSGKALLLTRIIIVSNKIRKTFKRSRRKSVFSFFKGLVTIVIIYSFSKVNSKVAKALRFSVFITKKDFKLW